MRRHAAVLLLCGSACLMAGLSLQGAVRYAALTGWTLGLAFTLAAATLAVTSHLRGD
ncbi:hypothetical protein J2Z79_001537 [Symbiobacterium terraclitae]|uniref:Uncharacterized protein n=1 Tax=Symbiobacterium terraclitae TaxID=557451 RepID=A0ABS4JRI3_9FIRM|nr:hypothetical protein [Symbiobacterium terraclitae]MBP2018138.1 hypothetical protein [Symbiobacterium terraclitae]